MQDQTCKIQNCSFDKGLNVARDITKVPRSGICFCSCTCENYNVKSGSTQSSVTRERLIRAYKAKRKSIGDEYAISFEWLNLLLLSELSHVFNADNGAFAEGDMYQ